MSRAPRTRAECIWNSSSTFKRVWKSKAASGIASQNNPKANVAEKSRRRKKSIGCDILFSTITKSPSREEIFNVRKCRSWHDNVWTRQNTLPPPQTKARRVPATTTDVFQCGWAKYEYTIVDRRRDTPFTWRMEQREENDNYLLLRAGKSKAKERKWSQ